MFNWLAEMMGAAPKNNMVQVPKREPGWTTPGEFAAAQTYDRSYGDPSAGFFQAGAKMRMPRDFMEMRRAFANDTLGQIGLQTIDQPTADRLYQAWLAAQSSPVAAVGFDPRKFITAPPSVTAGKQLTLGGSYSPDSDEVFSTGQFDSTLVHESIHRGIQKLKEAGLLPASANKVKEELLTRALMNRYYGPIEKGRGETADKQVDDAVKAYAKPEYAKILDEVEAAAQQFYYKQRPRGPR